jgi:hypothetical protein
MSKGNNKLKQKLVKLKKKKLVYWKASMKQMTSALWKTLALSIRCAVPSGQ